MGHGLREATSGLPDGSNLLMSCAAAPRFAFWRPDLHVSFPGRPPDHTAVEKGNRQGVYRRAVDLSYAAVPAHTKQRTCVALHC